MLFYVDLSRIKAVGQVILVAQELLKSFNLPLNRKILCVFYFIFFMLFRDGPVQPRDHAERADVPVTGGSS